MPDLEVVLIQAYTRLNSSRYTSTEDITCDPAYRTPYLDLVHQHIPDASEAAILRGLSKLRKQSKLPLFRRRKQSSN